jgi:hypothetical protein
MVAKTKFPAPTRNQTLTIQSIACHHTDSTVPVPETLLKDPSHMGGRYLALQIVVVFYK